MPLERVLDNKNIVRRALSDPNAFATTLLTVIIDAYGTEFLTWSPETIRMESEDDYSFKWPPINFDRLMAGATLLKTDVFYKSLPDFIELCNILSGSAASPDLFDPADVAECAWGITEALLLSPPEDEEPFTEEIRAYIGKMLDMEGIIVAPDILQIAIRDKDHKSIVHNDYSDDPEMYAGIWALEKEKTEEINTLVRERLQALIDQIALLQLANGDTAELAKKMRANLETKRNAKDDL